jgi:hypothetical protein
MISDSDTDEILITEQLPYLIHYNFHFDKTFQNGCCLSKKEKRKKSGGKQTLEKISQLSFSCSSLMHACSPDAFSGTSRTQKRRRVNVRRAGEGVVKTQTKEK